MNKKLLFWWHFLTDPSFRHYVYLHDRQKLIDEIIYLQREKALYESHKIYQIRKR